MNSTQAAAPSFNSYTLRSSSLVAMLVLLMAVLSLPAQAAVNHGVSAGDKHSCAVDNNDVECWGDDTYGQSTVPSLSNPIEVSLGRRHTCAIDDSGVVCWGGG